MKNFEPTFLGRVTSDWQTAHLKRIGRLKGGAGFPHDEQGVTDAEIPFYKVKHLQAPRYLSECDNYVTAETAGGLGAEIFPPDTIVFAKVGAALLLNRFRILTQPSCIDNNMTGLLYDHHCERDFLFYLLNQIEFSELFNQGPVPSVNSRQAGYITIPLPPLAEQKRIAAYLDASCTAIDRAVETKRKQLGTLDALRKSIIQKAVTQGLNPKVKMKESGVDWLGPIPAHWRARRIKDFVDARSGEGITSYEIEPEGDYPVYGGNGLRGYTNSYTHEGEFVLIGRQGALCGNINYASGKFYASEHAVVCRPYKTLQTIWFGALLDAMNLNQYSNSAAQPGLSVARIKRLMIPIPPVAERLEIERHLFDSSLAINKLTENITAQITTLTAYRKSLIHECVTGKRRISAADVAKVKGHG